jgi:AmmeMemoRadiSam system protein B
MRIREAAVAGVFYPAEQTKLALMVDAYTLGAQLYAGPKAGLKAVVGPHAGYKFSGMTAAIAYAPVRFVKHAITRVVLFSPAHRVYVKGVAATGADVFRMPMGDVPVDRAAVDLALEIPGVAINDEAHAPEHGVETHLPFLQSTLEHSPGWKLAPFLVGDAEPELVNAILEKLWGGPETLIVVSSDLSHFLPYDDARELDERTARAIVELNPEGLGENSACGKIPLQALLMQAKKRGLKAEQLDLRNSGDTAGSRDKVVGYGAFTFA